MARTRALPATETFRPRALLRAVVLAADTLWIAIFAALIGCGGATSRTFASAAFFIALFTACAFFYQRLAYTVEVGGLTVRSLTQVRHIPFADIRRVDVLPGLVGTSYTLRTRAGSLQFTSLLDGHDRLFRRIVQEAGLSQCA